MIEEHQPTTLKNSSEPIIRIKMMDEMYESADKTKGISVGEGFLNFTKSFLNLKAYIYIITFER